MQNNIKYLNNLDRYDVIIWDFDGVIIDSSKIRINAFRECLKEYPPEKVEELIIYHKKNDGLSRYVKIDYFFSNILEEKFDNKLRDDLLKKYGMICSSQLNDKSLIIDDSLKFIINYQNNKIFHIASGSDNDELNKLCVSLGISKLFKTINGSPETKINIVKDIIEDYKYNRRACCLIGDSINDYDAAMINGISFFGYNNIELLKLKNSKYISNFNL